MAQVPIIFISSTSDDLKEHREQAHKAALALEFYPRMMEYFPANGATPTLQACLDEVAKADVLVVLVAHRYGWTPDDPANPDAKSITWLECEHAWIAAHKEVLAFVVDPHYPWPAELREDYRLVTERKKPGIAAEVDRNEAKLEEFKRKLSGKFRGQFTDAASVRALVGEALSDWRRRHMPAKAVPAGDPETYLKALEDDTRQIRIKALRTKRAEPYFFGIAEIYIPLTTRDEAEPRRVALELALSHRNVAIIGDPGSGKSTFLRRAAFELCRTLRDARPAGAPLFLAAEDRRFPMLIRIAALAKLLALDKSPKPDDSPDWIPYFLGKQSEEYKWGLTEAFFRGKLQDGNCLVMFDGLDEAPERRLRERIARIFEKATQAFRECDFLVSTRPGSYEGDSLLEGFHPVRIGDLETPEINAFFDHFARALSLSEAESKKFKDGLELALTNRFEIRQMAGNPVMLTALAVLQHNAQRLPEHRVELYGSILGWLAAAREHQEGRPPAEKCLEFMRKLALSMQDAPGGRLVQVNRRTAAELSAQEFGGTLDQNEDLLERETQDSGILSAAGNDLRFWHLSFQEYLAALEIGGLSEKRQIERVVASGKLYHPEWRETMRLLGAVLLKQGEAKVEGLFQAILDTLGDRPKLADQARCAALLGAMLRDLSRMGYQPKTPGYRQTVKAVMRIFDAAEAALACQIDIRIRIEAADALGQVGDPRLEEDNWVTIPAGTFHMGAPKGAKKGGSYAPQPSEERMVTLQGFQLGRFPVTVQEFGAFIADGGYKARKHWPEQYGVFTAPGDWEQQQYPNRPVVGVSWFEAAAYCNWAQGRLPTEDEWERAARGPEGGQYPWGNKPRLDASRANYGGKVGYPTPVGLFPKGNTPEGLCDMLGNVWEWCADAGETTYGPAKVVRGGCWSDSYRPINVWDRYAGEPETRAASNGFRCARDLR
jgi:formylglycine-generating enzyme required for sulfatase activity